MRFTLLVLLCFCLSAKGAFAQTVETVKRDILSALSTPLPITVIGPLITRDVDVTPDGDGFRAKLDNALLMGIVPLGSLSFKLTPQGDSGNYRITDFEFPKSIEVFNAATLGIGATEFDGLWSSQSRSYQTLAFKLNDVSVLPKNFAGGSVKLGSLALDVDKEGQSGATESRFALAARNLISKGLPADDVAVSSIVAELKANGKEPVDLYAVISRFAILAAMQQDQSALLRFAESLRAKSYDSVSLNFTLDGFAMKPNVPGSDKRLAIERVSGIAGITDMTPDEWGKVVLNVDGANIFDKGYSDLKALEIAGGTATISGSQIPIGSTLSAITRLQALSSGQTVRISATDLIDGFLNFGRLAFTSKASGISVLPRSDREPTLNVGSYSTGFGLEGFRAQQGRVFVDSEFNELSIVPGKSSKALDARILRTLLPKNARYDVSVSELNEGLLRKLAADLVISSEDDLPGLAAPALVYLMAMRPVLTTREARFVSGEIDARFTGKVRFYPAWLLSALAYEGESRMTLAGFDKLKALLNDIEQSPEFGSRPGNSDRNSLAVMKGVLSTMKALSRNEDGNMVWNIVYPEAGKALFMVNDVSMRFPDIASYLPLMTMGAALR